MVTSVVIATYNGEKYIIEQLNSILNQSIMPDEIIIVDDCSSDKTCEVIEGYMKKNSSCQIKFYRNEKNLGYAKNFWKALHYATGKYIFLCDQDDIWENEKIEKIIKIFSENKKIMALNTNYELINENGDVINDRTKLKRFKNDEIVKIDVFNFLKSPRYPGMSLTVRKELIHEVDCLNIQDIIVHDWLLNFVATTNDGMYFYNKKLTKYRQHNSNTVGVMKTMSRSNLRKQRIQNLEVQMKLAEIGLRIPELDGDIVIYLNKLKQVLAKRVIYIDSTDYFRYFILSVTKMQYLSIRSILGDIYCIVRGRP